MSKPGIRETNVAKITKYRWVVDNLKFSEL